MKKEVRAREAPTPLGPYSQAIDAGSVYCSGQLGTDPSTGQLENGVVAQTRRALQNLDEVLKAAGLSIKDVVKTSVFLADISDYAQMNEEYAKHFLPPYPARTTLQAGALPRGARVEIDATAIA